MKRSRIFLVLAGVAIALLLAFFMQDVVRRAFVDPLAYLWWLIKLVAGAIPQLLLWILLLTTLVLIMLTSLAGWVSTASKLENAARSKPGPVEALSEIIARSAKGNYSKWVIAHRLGNIKREIEGFYDRLHPSPSEATDSDELSREHAVLTYLQAGLEESFVDYPQPALPFHRRRLTPFDFEIKAAVDYLESRIQSNTKKS